MNPSTEAALRMALEFLRVIVSFPGVLLILVLVFHGPIAEKIRAMVEGYAESKRWKLSAKWLTETADQPTQTTDEAGIAPANRPLLAPESVELFRTFPFALTIVEKVATYGSRRPVAALILDVAETTDSHSRVWGAAGLLFAMGIVELGEKYMGRLTERGQQLLEALATRTAGEASEGA